MTGNVLQRLPNRVLRGVLGLTNRQLRCLRLLANGQYTPGPKTKQRLKQKGYTTGRGAARRVNWKTINETVIAAAHSSGG